SNATTTGSSGRAASTSGPNAAPSCPWTRVPKNLTRKLIEAHLVAGKPVAGEEIGIALDELLLTDTNGTMAWLQLEAMGFHRVVSTCAAAYIDHKVYEVDLRESVDNRYY